MLRTAMLLIGLLVLAMPTFAQSDKSLQCPKVSITGPSGIVLPGSTTAFMLDIENPERYEFVWRVLERDTIIGGQGTTRLEMRRGNERGSLTAIVEVAGLPVGCPTVYTETITDIDGNIPIPEQIRELPISIARIDKAAISILIDRLLEKPYALGSIVLEFTADTPQKTASNYQKKIEAYIASQADRIDRDRFTFVRSAESDANRIKLYLVPPGATPPSQD